MDFKIIDAHSHLWLKQDTEIDGQPIKTLSDGRSIFFGEERQMIPPFMIDGRNSAEVFLSNMNYAQVSAAVVTQEYIDGIQNDYLAEVAKKYPERFFVCGMCEFRQPGFLSHAQQLIDSGFGGIKIPANRMFFNGRRIALDCSELMEMYAYMESKGTILSIDLMEGTVQLHEMNNIIKSFPNMKIAVGHFGMVTCEGWKEQIKLALNKNVMIESGGITWLFNEEFYPFTGAIKAIREAMDTVGADKLMWGSDYPRTITAITYKMSYDFILKSNVFSKEEKELFLGKNAQKFYGFRNLIDLPYIKNMSE